MRNAERIFVLAAFTVVSLTTPFGITSRTPAEAAPVCLSQGTIVTVPPASDCLNVTRTNDGMLLVGPAFPEGGGETFTSGVLGNINAVNLKPIVAKPGGAQPATVNYVTLTEPGTEDPSDYFGLILMPPVFANEYPFKV